MFDIPSLIPDLTHIIIEYIFDEEFIIHNSCHITRKDIGRYNNSIKWSILTKNARKLSDSFIDEFYSELTSNSEIMYWSKISEYCKLSESFIRKFKYDIYWNIVSQYQILSEAFIREFANYVNWNCVLRIQSLSRSFIREFNHKLDWIHIYNYTLSESFIREFPDKVDWNHISENQILSESFIREFAHKVNWSAISIYQILSESFIREFDNNVDWYYISRQGLRPSDPPLLMKK